MCAHTSVKARSLTMLEPHHLAASATSQYPSASLRGPAALRVCPPEIVTRHPDRAQHAVCPVECAQWVPGRNTCICKMLADRLPDLDSGPKGNADFLSMRASATALMSSVVET